MSEFPKDDKNLTGFLRKYRPDIPPAKSDFEQQLMTEIAKISHNSPKHKLFALPHRSLWLLPPTIAAGLLIAWNGHRALLSPQPSQAELASLEVFIENNWDGMVNDKPAIDPQIEWVSAKKTKNSPRK